MADLSRLRALRAKATPGFPSDAPGWPGLRLRQVNRNYYGLVWEVQGYRDGSVDLVADFSYREDAEYFVFLHGAAEATGNVAESAEVYNTALWNFIKQLEAEIAELRQDLAGRTVSCGRCEEMARTKESKP